MALEFFKTDDNVSDRRKKLVTLATNTLKINNIGYDIPMGAVDDFINGKCIDETVSLCFDFGKNATRACKILNKTISNAKFNAVFLPSRNGIAYLTLEEETDETLSLPEDLKDTNDVHELLDRTPKNRIFLTSDWHILGANYLPPDVPNKYPDYKKLVTWCKNNIKDDDVFMYLGDLCHKYATKMDIQKAAKIYQSLPGIKILILGNHDIISGKLLYENCGFKYVYTELIHDGIIYTHRPRNIATIQGVDLNIHGHKHDNMVYNVCPGDKNVNVYPILYNNGVTNLAYILRNVGKLTKNNTHDSYSNYGESTVQETKRSNLPDSAFGIPEDRKYPLDTEQHVKSAIKLFGHAEPSKKKALAKKIASAAKRYNIDIPDSTQVAKYLSESIHSLIPAEINTCIFDLGGVLVTGSKREDLENDEFIDPDDIDGLQKAIYDLFVDENEQLLLQEMIDKFYETLDEKYKKYSTHVFDILKNTLRINAYAPALLAYLKHKGYRVYYLSNWSKWSYELNKETLDSLLVQFDGGIISYQENLLKPNKEIYERLLDKYSLNPENCVFFDDKIENCDGAEKVGIKAIPFNSEETYKMIMSDLYKMKPQTLTEASDIHYDKESIMVDDNGILKAMDIKNICHWYVSNKRFPGPLEESNYSKSLIEAIEKCELSREEKTDFYVFMCNGLRQDLDHCFKAICIGIISVDQNKQYEWLIQYPVSIVDGEYKGLAIKQEWAMASMNPIVGITKPFILKVSNTPGTINTKQLLLSPDIISDKYFAISEDCTIKPISIDEVKNLYLESEYEFIGDKDRLNLVYEAYKNKKLVDQTFFYTALTGKPLLTEDQIDFDGEFKKIDFEEMNNNVMSNLATTKYRMENIIGVSEDGMVIDEHPFGVLSDKYGLRTMYCISGYYIESTIINSRSEYFSSYDELTYDVAKSVVKVQ